MPSISVCLATYNSEKYILPQLRSLLCQTRLPDEVIISDDCSSDKTVEIIRNFIAENKLESWKLSEHTENVGFVKNFARAFGESSGDLIFLCDHDDIWYKEKIEKITDAFSRNTKALAVNSSFDIIDGKGDTSAKKGDRNNGLLRFDTENDCIYNVSVSDIIRYNISPGCTAAFRSEIKDEYLKKSRLILPHDWELNIIAAKNGGLFYLDSALMGYRIHGDNEIGLESGASLSLKMNTPDEKRKRICIEQSEMSKIISGIDGLSEIDSRYSNRLGAFVKNRCAVIFERSFRAAVDNLFIYPSVRSLSTIKLRGLAGDIVYSLKSRK